MSVNPLVSAARLQNPTLHASPTRYSTLDTTDFGQLNRTVAQLADFIPWVQIDGARLEVRGHDPESDGRTAQFVTNAGTNMPPVEADPCSYRIDGEGGAGTPASYMVDLVQLTALVEVRDYASDLLGSDYPQAEFQKEAARHTIRKAWEQAAIIGGTIPTPTPPAFSGAFTGLEVFTGAASAGGQTIPYPTTTTAIDPLTALDGAMTFVVSHNRRVDLIVMNQDTWFRVLALHRSQGYPPDIRVAPETGQNALYFNNVPVCISDFVPTRVVSGVRTSDIYFMTLGEPDGVFAIVNKNYPDVTIKQTHNENSAFMSYQADFYSAIVSTTSDALVRLSGFPLGTATRSDAGA